MESVRNNKFHKVSMVLRSSRNEILKLENLLFTMNKMYKIDEERFINFHIAASEALMNAIIHGNKESAVKKVFVDIYEDDSDLQLMIKDEGAGFTQELVPNPTDDGNLLKDHGRGIFIMKS
ncbi:MAG: ATP-binding protein, partial [Ignavibacteria bacterium]|nr:ATP-binding protein [Ignavibacteria bacterium]